MHTTRRVLSASVIAPLAAAALLSGCNQGPPAGPAGPTRPIYAIDQTGGAKQCTVSPVTPVAGKEVSATMSVGNDGGWCAISVHQEGPSPFAAGLLTVPAGHGRVYIHPVGDDTRIDYTPDVGYVGPDAFTVTLLPGHSVIRTIVKVVR